MAAPTGPAGIDEKPWLSKAAAAELFVDAKPGPLFRDVAIGGPPPTSDARARIAAFARAHHVDIDLEVADNTLVAIHIEVLFGGCCGYEGVDMLALSLGRPRWADCCGCAKTWVDDWAFGDDIVHMRARARVNRLLVSWTRSLSIPEILARADELIGMQAADVAKIERKRWRELPWSPRGRSYFLEMPFSIAKWHWGIPFDMPDIERRSDLGLLVRAEAGTIVEVTLTTGDIADSESIQEAIRARWGRPFRTTDETHRWRSRGREIEVQHTWPYQLSVTRASSAR